MLHINAETGRCAHFQSLAEALTRCQRVWGDHWRRLVAQAQAGERRLSAAIAPNPLVLSASHADVVRSLNTPEQWQAWRARHDPSGVATVQLMGEETEDHLSVEAPLQILLGPAPVAVVMRTPGHDQELVTGFLLNEGIVHAVSDIVDVQHCADVELPAARGHVVRARLRQGAEVDVAKLSRNTYVGSSCGICGQASIERAMTIRGGISEPWSPALEVMVAMPERLRVASGCSSAQEGSTGLFDAEGRLWVVREDVGRHNAVDKVLGWLAHWRAHTPPLGLFVSGRVSFEIIQKALAADVAVVAGVSAPTSLAVDLAKEAGVSLWGFVRGGRANRYT